MADYLDVTKWARRDLFQFFLHFDNPYFNICTSVDVTRLLELLRGRPDVSVTLAYHYFALRVANEIEPFRYRLREGKVLIHDVINGGTTVLLPNESFSFAYFDYQEDFEEFITKAQQAVNEVQKGDQPFSPRPERQCDSLHDLALGIVHELCARAQLGTRRFGSENCLREVCEGERPHSVANLCRSTPCAHGWTARRTIPDAVGRTPGKTGNLGDIVGVSLRGHPQSSADYTALSRSGSLSTDCKVQDPCPTAKPVLLICVICG